MKATEGPECTLEGSGLPFRLLAVESWCIQSEILIFISQYYLIFFFEEGALQNREAILKRVKFMEEVGDQLHPPKVNCTSQVSFLRYTPAHTILMYMSIPKSSPTKTLINVSKLKATFYHGYKA